MVRSPDEVVAKFGIQPLVAEMFLSKTATTDPLFQAITKSLTGLLRNPTILGMIGLMVAVGLLRLFLRRPHVKGALGEAAVRMNFSLQLPSETYQRLDDILIPNGSGGWTQIDHLVVSQFGIFVVETKNYSGWIFGDDTGSHWTQSFPTGRKERMLNPLRQNEGHISALSKLLGLPKESFHNLVALAGEAVLKKGPIPGVFTSGLAKHIRSFQHPIFEHAQVTQIMVRLRESDSSNDPNAKAAHLKEVEGKKVRR